MGLERVLKRPRSSDAGAFGRNFVASAGAQIVGQVLTLVVSIFLARRLDVSAYGIFVFGFAFPSWFMRLVSLGLDEVMTIDIAADRGRASRYLTLVALLRLALAPIALGALWVATQLLLADPFARTITMVLGASTVLDAYANTFFSVYRAFERFEYVAFVMVVERVVATAGAVAFLLLGYGLLEVALSFLGASLVSVALALLVTRRRFTSFTRDVDVRGARQLVKSAIPFGLHTAIWTFTYSAGVVLLTVMQDPASTAVFNAAFTLIVSMFSFLVIVNYTILPTMSRFNSESRERLAALLRRIQKLALIAGVPLALGGWFYADAIVDLFFWRPDNAFQVSGAIFRILVLSFSVQTAVMANEPALAAVGRMKQNLYIGFVGGIATVGLTLALIPPLGPIGAAYAFLAGQIMIAALSTIAVRRYIAPLHVGATPLKAVAAGFGMLVVLFAIPSVSLWIGMLIGAAAYFAALFAIRGASREDGQMVWDGLRGVVPIGIGRRAARGTRRSRSL